MAKPGIALQLFGVREDMQKDFVGTLRRVSQIGYRAVEMVSYFGDLGHTPAQLKKLLGELQLQPIGVHVAGHSLDESFAQTVTYYRDAGVPEIIIAAIPHEYYESADGFRRGGELLGKLARQCRDLGVGLSYHN